MSSAFKISKSSAGGVYASGSYGTSMESIIFKLEGSVQPTTGSSRWNANAAGRIAKLVASIDTVSPVNTVFALMRNGNTQVGSDITILAGQFKSDIMITSEYMVNSDYFTVDIKSGTGGADAYLTAYVTYDALQDTASLTQTSVPTLLFKNNYDMSVFVQGVVPVNTLIYENIAIDNYTISGVASAVATGVSTTATSFDIQVNGTSIGDITFPIANTRGTVTLPQTYVAKGDVVSIFSKVTNTLGLSDLGISIGGLSAANEFALKGAKGDKGDVGVTGPSAYDLAVAQGFVGTKAAWLLTLKGASGTGGGSGNTAYLGEGTTLPQVSTTVTSTTKPTNVSQFGGSFSEGFLDDNTYNISLPFPFLFNGVDYSADTWVCMNSFVSFGSSTDSWGLGDDPTILTNGFLFGASDPVGRAIYIKTSGTQVIVRLELDTTRASNNGTPVTPTRILELRFNIDNSLEVITDIFAAPDLSGNGSGPDSTGYCIGNTFTGNFSMQPNYSFKLSGFAAAGSTPIYTPAPSVTTVIPNGSTFFKNGIPAVEHIGMGINMMNPNDLSRTLKTFTELGITTPAGSHMTVNTRLFRRNAGLTINSLPYVAGKVNIAIDFNNNNNVYVYADTPVDGSPAGWVDCGYFPQSSQANGATFYPLVKGTDVFTDGYVVTYNNYNNYMIYGGADAGWVSAEIFYLDALVNNPTLPSISGVDYTIYYSDMVNGDNDLAANHAGAFYYNDTAIPQTANQLAANGLYTVTAGNWAIANNFLGTGSTLPTTSIAGSTFYKSGKVTASELGFALLTPTGTVSLKSLGYTIPPTNLEILFIDKSQGQTFPIFTSADTGSWLYVAYTGYGVGQQQDFYICDYNGNWINKGVANNWASYGTVQYFPQAFCPGEIFIADNWGTIYVFNQLATGGSWSYTDYATGYIDLDLTAYIANNGAQSGGNHGINSLYYDPSMVYPAYAEGAPVGFYVFDGTVWQDTSSFNYLGEGAALPDENNGAVPLGSTFYLYQQTAAQPYGMFTYTDGNGWTPTSMGLQIASSNVLGAVSIGDGLSINNIGHLSNSNKGMTVLRDTDPYWDTNFGDGYAVAKSIGAGGDFATLQDFADYVNNINLTGDKVIYGYFNTNGVVTLTEDVYFTNSNTMGNIYIGGYSPSYANGDNFGGWDGTTNIQITDIVDASNGSLVVTLATIPNTMFVGAIMSIYPADVAYITQIPYLKMYSGAYKVTAITGNNVTMDYTPASGVTPMFPIAGISLSGYIANTTLDMATFHIEVTGNVGNVFNDGGFRDLGLTNGKLMCSSNAATLVVSDRLSFVDARMCAYGGGYFNVMGDVFFGGFSNFDLRHADYTSPWGDHYFGTDTAINLDASSMDLNSVYTTGNISPVGNLANGSTLIMHNPIVADENMATFNFGIFPASCKVYVE